MKRIKRIWCVLFGCAVDDDGYCPRCAEHIYEGYHFVQRGKLEWIVNLWWRLSWRMRRRTCDTCHCRLSLRQRWRGESCCSKWCYSNWIPF